MGCAASSNGKVEFNDDDLTEFHQARASALEGEAAAKLGAQRSCLRSPSFKVIAAVRVIAVSIRPMPGGSTLRGGVTKVCQTKVRVDSKALLDVGGQPEGHC